LYHILLDKKLKEQRDISRCSQNERDLENLRLDSPQSETNDLMVSDDHGRYGGHQVSKFLPSKPMKLEIEEGRDEELSRYLSGNRRRGTIAVSHINDGAAIPEISICRSPSPTNDKSELQYKERSLPRPAVLNVRPTFDRRASEGTATLQDSITQFNLQWKQSKPGARVPLPNEHGSRNMLSVPENETAGSESDTEHEQELMNYMHGRGSRSRRTLPCFPTTPVKPSRNSPTPYLTDLRMREFVPSAKKLETLGDVLEQHKQLLQDQFNPGRRSSATGHPREHTRENIRHSHPFSDVEPMKDLDLAILRKKQEAQRADLRVEFLVRKKILETKMAAERRDLLRRASEGTPNLESQIADYHRKHGGGAGLIIPPVAGGNGGGSLSGASNTELQDEMEKLNLVPSFDPAYSTGSMDVDDEVHDMSPQPRYRYGQVPPLFNNHSASAQGEAAPSRASPATNNPYVPSFGGGPVRPSFPGMDSPLLHDPFMTSLNSPDRDTIGGEIGSHESLSRTLSYDMTFTQSLEAISERVKISLNDSSVEYSQSGDTYFSLFRDGIQMEIEIYPVTGAKRNHHTVKFRRVGGELWPYKKLRDEIVTGLCS